MADPLFFLEAVVLSRFGLRSRMAVSYVLVSAAAVVVVEVVLLAVMVPRMRSASDSVEQARERVVQAESNALQAKAKTLAVQIAADAGGEASLAAARTPGRSDGALLADAAAAGFIRTTEGPQRADDPAAAPPPEMVRVLATVDGRVVSGDPATVFARGSRLPPAAVSASARSGRATVNGQEADWASTPVEVTDRTGRRVIGIGYAMLLTPRKGEASADAAPVTAAPAGKEPVAVDTGVGFLVMPGVLILVVLLPVGALFGLLTTGRLIRRVQGLAAGTSAMAEGDLTVRIPVCGEDEVGRLERAFNVMAQRLDAAVQVERRAAGRQARTAERTRIARELHDSISQHLFSANLVAGGLRKALPSGSELRRQAESMESSLARTMREMRAMLLEMRPIALEDAGLAEALDELCRAYETRLGVSIGARVDPPWLDPSVEHAALRVVQEAVGNAVRHGEPRAIEVEVAAAEGGRVAVTVRDDGQGFDPASVAERHGMGLPLMRERVEELGGTMQVHSAPGQGTAVTVLLPVEARQPGS